MGKPNKSTATKKAEPTHKKEVKKELKLVPVETKQISSPVKNNNNYYWIAIISIVVIFISNYLSSSTKIEEIFSGRGSYKEYVEYNWVKGSVPVLTLNQEEDFAAKIASTLEPVILRNTSVLKWKAMESWNPDYISQNTPQLQNVQRHFDKTFSYFQEHRPMSSLPSVQKSYKGTTYQRVNMTASEFFEVFHKTPPYHYYTASAEDLGKAYHDLYPIEGLMVKGSQWKKENSFAHRWTNVWFGPAGATTHTHYDISHNFYAQVYGTKRFVLFSPNQTENLYLYPMLHPGGQQSQVRFESPDYELFPKFEDAKAIEAILHPGDVLYLPPLWYHHVSALTASMSVSVWTRFPEVQKMWAAEKLPLPFKKSWGSKKMAMSGRIFLEMFLNTIIRREDAIHFVQNLLDSRFDSLVASGALIQKANPRFDQVKKGEETISYCSEDLFPVTEDQVIEKEGHVFHDFVEERADFFDAITDVYRRDIWLGNNVEQLALTVVGVDNIVNFLRDFVRC